MLAGTGWTFRYLEPCARRVTALLIDPGEARPALREVSTP